MKKIPLILAFLLSAAVANAQLSAGSIAFTGFNSDGKDDLSFVNFTAIPANTTIYLTDNEWSGTAFLTGEGFLKWQSGAAIIPVGSIVSLRNLTDSTRSASVGTIQTATGTFNITGSNDGVFAYIGASQTAPTAFLTCIMNGTVAASVGSLSGTNLIENNTAFLLTDGADIAAYTGARTGLTADDYLIALGNNANWVSQDATGDNSIDGIAPDVPFSTTPFVISLVDNSPPSVVGVEISTQATFRAVFSEKISRATAIDTLNYVFTPTLSVQAVSYDSLRRTALVVVSGFGMGTKYKLTANKFKDLSANQQTTPSVFDNLFFNNYAADGLVISELMYNIGTGGDSLEFIEIYNKSAANVPLGGLKFSDGVTGTLPELTLGPQKFFYAAADSGAFKRFYGVTPNMKWAVGQNLNNAGETVKLSNSLDLPIDSVAYLAVAPWVIEPKGNGPSLEIINPANDNNDAANWRAATKPLGKKYGGKDVFCSIGSVGIRLPTVDVLINDFQLSPNPTAERLAFSRSLSGDVVDALGRVVLSFKNQTTLDVRTLDNGIYFLSANGLVKKFIVRR